MDSSDSWGTDCYYWVVRWQCLSVPSNTGTAIPVPVNQIMDIYVNTDMAIYNGKFSKSIALWIDNQNYCTEKKYLE